MCQNDGVCVPARQPGASASSLPLPTCLCPPGLTGATCVTPVASCSESPCRNGGVCLEDGAAGFLCRCEGTGFTGRYCEQEPPTCDSCQNSGVCLPQPGGSRLCDCAPGFAGSDCSERTSASLITVRAALQRLIFIPSLNPLSLIN